MINAKDGLWWRDADYVAPYIDKIEQQKQEAEDQAVRDDLSQAQRNKATKQAAEYAAALREVQEETGIDELVLRDLICITDHCYIRDGKWHLKHTWWYDMLYTDPTDLTPQTEEDISKAAWVAKSSLPPFLLNTYPSIIEVFREAKI